MYADGNILLAFNLLARSSIYYSYSTGLLYVRGSRVILHALKHILPIYFCRELSIYLIYANKNATINVAVAFYVFEML